MSEEVKQPRKRESVVELRNELRKQQAQCVELFNEAKRCQQALAQKDTDYGTIVAELETQLKAQGAKIEVLEEQLSKTQKDKENAQAVKSSYEARMNSAEAETDQLHMFLDGLPGVLPRKLPPAEGNYYERVVSAPTRLMSYLAGMIRGAS